MGTNVRSGLRICSFGARLLQIRAHDEKHLAIKQANKNMTDVRSDEFDSFFRLAFESVERLARVLFEKQEQILPNGDVWDELEPQDKNFWIASATSIIEELQRIAGSQDREGF
jgi:hypothetical protein